ncbi:hypothetical protein [Pelagibacterium luteolum]|uniref:Uncharacterized protein n=1 Tax=Pelagibacterium luteolum TaxID=440168 RepID=A0A1G7ZHX6_9HYPH|nr:hypothetical protein [Pelagibacterium luteolum]SDH08177.1 hypothetical protein SAMN04487974_12022 [Pelagibacterium luteolum]
MEQCGTCKFWRIRSDEAAGKGGGYCVRFPPFAPAAFNVWMTSSGQTGEVTASSSHLNDAWPNVHIQSWCGEYQQALEAEQPSNEKWIEF